MATELTVQQHPKLSLAAAIAADYGMEVQPFMSAIKGVVFPAQDRNGNPPTDAQMIAYLSVCKRYGLDPFVKQLWPFPQKSGGFIPVASYDGWLYILNQQEQYDGDEYEEERDEKGTLIAGVIKIFRKDRTRPVIKRCYLKEWSRNTEPWNNQPHHMLELRTRSQGARLAFNISGIFDEDEAQFIDARNITSEATEISRQSLSKTEVLKEKIAEKKAAATPTEAAKPLPPNTYMMTEDDPAAQRFVPPEPEPSPAPEPTPAMEEAKKKMREKKAAEPKVEQPAPPPPTTTTNGTGSLFSNLEESEPVDLDRNLTKDEYQALLSVLQAKCLVAGKPDKEREDKVTKAARQKFMEYGAANSKQLRYRDYEAVLTWAKNLSV